MSFHEIPWSSMRFYDVPVNRSVPTKANRGLTSYIVQYITKLTKLTKQGRPPMREMIRNFSLEVAYQQLSKSRVTCFINRHEIYLISCNDAGKTRDLNLAWSHSEAYGSA
jgi:hypothetical protein